MLLFGILLVFVWLFASLFVVVDMFKRHFAIGCLGFFLIPILPFFWVLTCYSRNKKRMATVLFFSAIVGFSIIGYFWVSASKELKPFIYAAYDEDLPLALRGVAPHGINNLSYIVLSSDVYEPLGSYASTEEMLSLIRDEKVDLISSFYPNTLKEGTIIELRILTNSGFVAVFEIKGPRQIEKSYTRPIDDLLD